MMERKNLSLRLAIALSLLLQLNGCFLDAGAYDCDGPCIEEPEASHDNSYVCSCTCTEPEVLTLKLQVMASDEDSSERADGTIVLDAANLNFSVSRANAVRFPNVILPQGVDVLNASLQFVAAETEDSVISYEITGDAADNAAPFTLTPNDLTGRTATANSVTWSPPAWNTDESGAAQQTPNLEAIIDEIVKRPGWSEGNALAFIISAGTGAGLRTAYAYDGKPLVAAVLTIEYLNPDPQTVGPQDLPVCMPVEFNQNLDGTMPSDVNLAGDCKARVEKTLEGMSQACGYPSECECAVQPDSRRFDETCDQPCVEDPLDEDCSDFDPVGGVVTATNAEGDAPICVTDSPMAKKIYGQRSACRVDGSAQVEIDGERAEPAAQGMLYFRGEPCTGGRCAVGLEYRLDIDPITFGNVFGSATFSNLAGIGESPAESALLDRGGNGTFAPKSLTLSARGVRGREQYAMSLTNSDRVDVNVRFGTNPTCALGGAMLGGADPETKRCLINGTTCVVDGDCPYRDVCVDTESSPLSLSLDLAGTMVNQPPTADAGADQIVECPDAPVLDARRSSDFDGNLSIVTWRRGHRVGPEVGHAAVTQVQQGLGSETYALRVIDSFGQTDEDTTTVAVVDTSLPTVRCGVRMPVIEPTNHTMVNVGLAGSAHDACEGTLPVGVRVFGNEDDESKTGDGNFSPDGRELAPGTLRLRGERNGKGDGRVYLMVVEATDSSGNRGIDCCTAVVPSSKKTLRSVLGQADAARAYCLANAGAAPAGYVTVGDGPLVGPKQ